MLGYQNTFKMALLFLGDPIGISTTKASHNFPGSFETTSEEFLGLEKLFKNIKSSVKVVQVKNYNSNGCTKTIHMHKEANLQ